MSSLAALQAPQQQGGMPSSMGGGALMQYIQTLPLAQQAQWLGANEDLQQGAGQLKTSTEALAQSDALRKQLAGQTPYGLGGGIGNGLAQALGAVGSGIQAHKQQAALNKTSGANDAVLDLLLKQAQGAQGQPSLDDMRTTAAQQGGMPPMSF